MALRILVVDDAPEFRTVIKLLLEAQGHAVEVVADGKAAVDAAVRNQPHVVLMDLAMPGMDGLAATRELRARAETANIPVIAVSAYANQSRWIASAVEAGCTDVLLKPVDQEQLAQVLLRYAPG